MKEVGLHYFFLFIVRLGLLQRIPNIYKAMYYLLTWKYAERTVEKIYMYDFLQHK